MTEVGELVVKIKADSAQLERGVQKAEAAIKQSAGRMERSFSGLKAQLLALTPALSAVAFVQFGKHAIDAAGHIVDLADRIGFVSSTLAALEIPLAASGSNLDEFTAAINRMNNILGEAAKGNEEAVKAFDQLGLSVDKLRKMSPEEQFYEIASALGQIKDQSKQTEAGMNLFGRGFAAMLPLLKEYGGDMRKAVEAQRDLGNTLDADTLKRIDAFGDSMSEAGLKIEHAFLRAFAAVLKVIDAVSDVTAKPATNAKSGLPGENPLPQSYIDKATANGFVTAATFAGKEQYGPAYQKPSAKGSNDQLNQKSLEDQAKLAQDAKDALDDYNRSLEQESELLQLSGRDAAALEARFKVEEIGRKANLRFSEEEVDAIAERAAANYDLKESQDDLNKSIVEAARFQQELHDKLSDSLTDIAFDFDNAADSAKNFALAIAKAAFEKRIAGPIADSLIGSGGGKGIFDSAISSVGSFLGFADGGDPPVGVPSVVGERGPEIFVPKTSGTVIPNHKLGGTNVNVYQTFALNPGATEQTVAQLRSLVPTIMAQTKADVFAAMQSGGSGSKIIGARS